MSSIKVTLIKPKITACRYNPNSLNRSVAIIGVVEEESQGM